MGAITLNEYINSGALDDFKILAVKAYDKPAVELNFIDVRHSYAKILLLNPKPRRKPCSRSCADWYFKASCFRSLVGCVKCLTCLCTCCCCCCGDVCRQTTAEEQAMFSEVVTLVFELTGTMTRGAFMSLMYLDYFREHPVTLFDSPVRDIIDGIFTIKDVTRCLPSDELIQECVYKGNMRFGELRMKIIGKYLRTKYNLRENNCFHFVMSIFEALSLPTEGIERRRTIIEQNVRRHSVLVPPLQRLIT